MSYPNFKNKYLEEALFSPIDFVKYKEYMKKNKFPKKYILTYQTYAKNHFLRKYKPKEKIKLHKFSTIYLYRDIGLVRIIGVGAPNASTIFEKLIALGGRIFLNIGTAGGLHHEGVFLCKKALRDEGTSYHYVTSGRFSYPDERLTNKFIIKQKLEYFGGTTWTIDAPYRETKAEIEKYARQGISTVEMEASALFAIAKIRKVKIASAFVVSDILGKKWSPQFHRIDVKKTQNKLIDAAVECLSK